jgi:hypothetical protein
MTPFSAEWVEHFRYRVLQDALDQCTVDYWLRYAHDHAHYLTPLQKLNIQRHVELLRSMYGEPISPEVLIVLAEVT